MKQVKARYCVKKESNIFIPWSLESVDFKAFLDVWDALKIWFCDNFVTNGGKITDLQRRSILISWSAYAIMPVGKKDMTMFHVNKERTPVCTTNTCEGSSLFISVVEHPPGYSFSCYDCLTICKWDGKSYLPQQPLKKIWLFPCVHLPPVAGSRLDNAVSITQLRTEWNI